MFCKKVCRSLRFDRRPQCLGQLVAGALDKGDHHAALQEYLKGAPNSPAHWYQAALIAFQQGDYVAACTYLRRGIAANPYIAEGLNGRTMLSEHLYWHASKVHGP